MIRRESVELRLNPVGMRRKIFSMQTSFGLFCRHMQMKEERPND